MQNITLKIPLQKTIASGIFNFKSIKQVYEIFYRNT